VTVRSMNVSVVIPAFNEAGSIGALLEAIYSSRLGRHRLGEVIVYDDGSSDNTATTVELIARSNATIRLLRNDQHHGLPRAFQALIQAASGDVIVRLDADTLIGPDTIALLADEISDGCVLAIGANEPVLERLTIAALSAAFATSAVERLKKGPHKRHYAVGRLAAYAAAPLKALAIPDWIINEDHYAAVGVTRQGGRVKFVPRAKCRFKVPTTFADYRSQSRRVIEGERQLCERFGVEQTPTGDVIAAVAASALRQPVAAVCWALLYLASSIQPTPARCSPWPTAVTTKGPLA
jgi:glycosyltransferase involved in cell wall biosynthesis